MKNQKKIVPKLRILIASALSIFLLCSTGCASYSIEHDPADQQLIGQLVRFSNPMAYILLSQKDLDDFDKEAVRIGREIMSRRDIEDQFSVFHEYPREYFKDGMTFTIVGAYWVRQGFVEREFAPDMHMVILKDENGVLSVCSIRKINSIKTNTLGELE